jgi:hypothetical protein
VIVILIYHHHKTIDIINTNITKNYNIQKHAIKGFVRTNTDLVNGYLANNITAHSEIMSKASLIIKNDQGLYISNTTHCTNKAICAQKIKIWHKGRICRFSVKCEIIYSYSVYFGENPQYFLKNILPSYWGSKQKQETRKKQKTRTVPSGC